MRDLSAKATELIMKDTSSITAKVQSQAQCVGGDPVVGPLRAGLDCEPHICGLGLPVGRPRLVRAALEVTCRRTQRLRALDKRWLPWLNSELATLELSLEQAEQDDGIRRAGTQTRHILEFADRPVLVVAPSQR